MNINRSYLRVAIIAIVVMIGTISAAYAAPTSFLISGVVLYEDGSECNDSAISVSNLATGEAWAAETNESSNYYHLVLDSNNVSANVTLRFKAISPDISQSSATKYVVTQGEVDYGGFVYNIDLADTIPPVITSVVLDPVEVEPNETISVDVIATDAAGVFSVTADDVALALVNGTWEGVIKANSTYGVHDVTIVAIDTLDNVAKNDETTYEVLDTTLPEITSVAIDLTKVVPNESINVTVVATDAAGVFSVTADDVALALVNGTWEGMIKAESAAGIYSVTVVATDASGNVAEDNKTTYEVLDITPPEIGSVVFDPEEPEPDDPINVTVTVTDTESAITSVTADGAPLTADGNDTWIGTITAANASGTYDVTVVATDAANNSKDAIATYTIPVPDDTTPPEIGSVVFDPEEPEPDDPINVTVTVTDTESAITSVTADGAPLTADGNDTWIGTITAANASGTYDVTVVATDAANNSKDAIATYTIPVPDDTTPPEIGSVVFDPEEPEPDDPINVTVTVTDTESAITSVTADGAPLTADGNDTWIGTITAANASGTYDVTVVATDAANNSKDAIATYTIPVPDDTTPPEIGSVVFDPEEPEPDDPINVTVTVTDTESAITSVTADGAPLTADGNDTWIGTITAANASGTYDVTVVATDAANNSKDAIATYTIPVPDDTTPPEIGSVVFDPEEPEPDDPINVTVTVTDTESAITSVTADGAPLTADGNDTWIGTITAANASGTYDVTVVATDAANNSKDAIATYTIPVPDDTTPPEIGSVVFDPEEPEPDDPINVTVTVTDTESAITSVTADGAPLTADGNDTWIGTITAANASGTYDVTVVATDAANNSKDAIATYTIPDTPPVIGSVVFDPKAPAPDEQITVTVTVTDPESAITSVTADGVALTDVGNDTWTGTITAANASGTYNVTIVATDATNNSNDAIVTYTIPDTPPVIVSVEINPAVVAPNGAITVTVNVTDDESDVANVTANGDELAFDNGTWEGTITAESAADVYNVTVVATDAAGNEAVDNKTTYEVVPEDTILHIEDVNVSQGGDAIVPITVFNVVDMGGCEITFTYDPTVVYVTDVARGDLNYSFEYNINNGSGWMRANALDADGRSGDVIFAHVTLTAMGNKSDTSEMEFEASRLIDTSYNEIAHVLRNGLFTILPNELPEVTNVSATPDKILYDNDRPRAPGTNVTSLSAHVTDVDGNITTVTIDLSSIGGSQVQLMEHVSGDVWAVNTTATEGVIDAPNFTHQLTIVATDNDGGINDSVSIELTVLKRGDVTGDGLVDKADADYISRYLAGLEPEASNPPVELVGDVVGKAGDPLGDGVVDLLDALYIARYNTSDEMEGEP